MSRVLYGFGTSSAAYRVRIALAVKGLDWEGKSIDLLAGAQHGVGYRILNPQGLVPLLIDGDVALNQSMAIIEYLDETYPEPSLLPGDAVQRARIRAAAQTIACDIHPLNNLRVQQYLKDPLEQPQAAVDDWVRHWITTGFQPLEELAEAGRGPYLFGDQITLADICLVPQMANARRARADLSAFPKLVAVDKALNAHPAVKAARPEHRNG